MCDIAVQLGGIKGQGRTSFRLQCQLHNRKACVLLSVTYEDQLHTDEKRRSHSYTDRKRTQYTGETVHRQREYTIHR